MVQEEDEGLEECGIEELYPLPPVAENAPGVVPVTPIKVGERIRYIGSIKGHSGTWPEGIWLEKGMEGTVTEYHPPIPIPGEMATEAWAHVKFDNGASSGISADDEGKRWERVIPGKVAPAPEVTKIQPTYENLTEGQTLINQAGERWLITKIEKEGVPARWAYTIKIDTEKMKLTRRMPLGEIERYYKIEQPVAIPKAEEAKQEEKTCPNLQPMAEWIKGETPGTCRHCILAPVVQWYWQELKERGLEEVAKQLKEEVDVLEEDNAEQVMALCKDLDEIKAAAPEELRKRLEEFDCSIQSFDPDEFSEESSTGDSLS